jgi:hypothetical protein
MAQATGRARQRRRLSLSVRLSLLVLAAALLPLALVVGYTNYQAQNKLKQQGQASLLTDAGANAKAVAAYMQERTKDGDALATLTTTQALLACPHLPAVTQQIPPQLAPYLPVLTAVMKCTDPLYNELSSVRALKVGIVRDINYTIWSLYDASAHEILSCRPDAKSEAQCGTGLPGSNVSVPQEDLAGLKAGQQFISAVNYDAKAGSAFVQIYTPIKLNFVSVASVLGDLLQAANAQGVPASVALPGLSTDELTQLVQAVQTGQLATALKALPTPTVGYIRSTLKLDYVWSIVNKEQGANGSGSYAFITDQNGVRVADANSSERFTTVHPLDATTQQLIQSEQRYGSGTAPTVDGLPGVWSVQQSTSSGPSSFQSVAVPGDKLTYQYVGIHLTNVAPPGKGLPLAWTYFVLSPLPTVTQVADDQVQIALEAAVAVAVLAVLLGLLLGRGMASPVQRSVADLQGASESLYALATKQRNSATEQQWVVDACKTGLESVRYLSDAMHQASARIVDAANWFGEYWDRLTEDQAQRTVQHLRELSRYIEEASRRQWTSSERLDKAITVTTQVSDQLAAGASAAADSAEQLDDVVHQLQHVVGGRVRAYEGGAYEDESGYAAPDEMPFPELEPRLPVGGGQRALPPGPSGNSGPRAPLMPGGWQPGVNQGGGMSAGYPGGSTASGFGQGGFGPQRAPASPSGGFGQGGFGQGGFGPQRAPASPNVGAGSGQEYGQEYDQGASAGWGGGPANGRGVRVWEDQ